MHVVVQREDLPVHVHQIDQCHSFATELLFKVNVENLCKSDQHNLSLVISKGFKTLLVFVLKVLFSHEEHVWQAQQVNYQGDDQDWWVEHQGDNQVKGILAFEGLALVVQWNVDRVDDAFYVEQWEKRNWEDCCNEAIHQDHEGILDFEEEVTHSFALKHNHWDEEWQSDQTNGEEGCGDSSIGVVVALRVLELDDLHSSDGIDVLPHVLVPVDEHCHQEAEQQNLEDVNEDGDESLTLWFFVVGEALSSIDSIEDVKDDQVEAWLLYFEFLVQLSANNNEGDNNETECNHELLKLSNHEGDH